MLPSTDPSTLALAPVETAGTPEPSYVGRITKQAHGKHGERVQWFVSVTHPTWTSGVDSIGHSVLLGKQDAEDWKQAKREHLRHNLLKHAADNQLSTDGLDAYLAELLKGVQP